MISLESYKCFDKTSDSKRGPLAVFILRFHLVYVLCDADDHQVQDMT